ncbi:MAG: response regulator [Desulfamplus sp.]|nr:response regulator [Desulfamplus sp.]
MNDTLFKPKILIVDDIAENLFALERVLGKIDAEIIKASSGNEALTLILEHDFALIILDVQMPEMDGYEVAELIKSNEKTENVPIIFVTAIDREDSKEIKGYNTGAVDFIFKPLNKQILLSKINVFLELYRIKNGLEQLVDERTRELYEINQKLKELIKKNVKATREIEYSHSYLLKVIDSISSCLVSVDYLGRITDMNCQGQILSGVTPRDAIGKPVAEVFPFYAMLTQMIQQAIASGQPVEKHRIPVYLKSETIKAEFIKEGLPQIEHSINSIKLNNLSYKNEPIINDFAIYPFCFNNNHGAVIRIDDVTERVKREEMAIQNEKKLTIDTIHRLTWASEYKDEDTGSHIQRMSNYSTAIAKRLGINPNTVESISYAAPMHDIGKIGIPDRILLKPGKLTPEEWEIMKRHTLIGAKILKGSKSGFIRLGELIAMTHHEKWDGSGYPLGLQGSKIPMVSRIVALADVFDSLTTKRPYKEPFSLEKSYQIIREGKGSHFDPDVVDAFFEILDEILKIKNKPFNEEAKVSFINQCAIANDIVKLMT